MAKITNEELADSLDELWVMLSEQGAAIEEIRAQLAKRDTMNRLLVAHVERLVREKHALMVHLGYKYLESKPSAVLGGADALSRFASGKS